MSKTDRLILCAAAAALALPVVALRARRQDQPAPAPSQAQAQALPPDPQGLPRKQTYPEYLEIFRQPSFFTQVLEKKALAEPFVGITTNGKVTPGLFSIQSTGVSTEPVRKAAEAYLASLTPEERKRSLFPMDSDKWRKWDNMDVYYRLGVGFYEMTDAQKEAGINLLRASLSAKGLKLSRDIMKLNYHLGEITQNTTRLGEWTYFITIMGTPSATGPWGWQIDGHHLIINYFVLGDQVVMSPAFFGAEPTIADSGKYAGTQVLQVEQQKGLEMVHALDDEQRKRAVIKVGAKTENENIGEAFKDNVVLDYAGVPVSSFTRAEKAQLVDLIGEYVSRMDDGHARVKMAEVEQHLDQTYFAWIGAMESGGVFYYRIHSPVILIEFDHQTPIGLSGPGIPKDKPTFLHIHTVVRTPNGGDYGKDLLRLHYLQNPGTHAE